MTVKELREYLAEMSASIHDDHEIWIDDNGILDRYPCTEIYWTDGESPPQLRLVIDSTDGEEVTEEHKALIKETIPKIIQGIKEGTIGGNIPRYPLSQEGDSV